MRRTATARATLVGGAFNGSATANWTDGIVPEGTGVIATFTNNYTITTQINFGLGGGDTTSLFGTSDNAAGDTLLTLGTGTIKPYNTAGGTAITGRLLMGTGLSSYASTQLFLEGV